MDDQQHLLALANATAGVRIVFAGPVCSGRTTMHPAAQ